MIRSAVAIAAVFLMASTCGAQPAASDQQSELPFASELEKYPGLLPEFGQLVAKLQQKIQFPAGRGESRLLQLLPASTMSYAAFPNYGDALHQTLQIFHEELRQSEVLRNWWEHGQMAKEGPKLEMYLEKLSQMHEYLGEEIVVSGAMEGRESNLLVVAEVRKPGLKAFLEQMIVQIGGKSKPGVHVLDPQELAAMQGKGAAQDLYVLVRPDFVAAASDVATLRSFNSHLERGGREFASTPFGQRVLREYQGGVTVLAAADLQKIVASASQGAKQDAALQQSGFAEVKYLVWVHKSVAGENIGQTELSFTGPRHGAASWLAKPALLHSLDFVSPKAMVAGSIVLSNPAQIFDDVQQLAGPSSNAFAAIAGGAKALNLSVKDDLLGLLKGELTLELDSITPPQPTWRAILGVNDAKHLQQTLSTLLAAAHMEAEPIADGDVTYYTVRIPSGKTTIEIGYAFVERYLVIGSSHGAIVEAVALHKSGGSLGQSKRFLASLPPGHPAEVSALLYQDPIAMAMLQMRRFAPEMAESLAQSSAEVSPSVVCLYGEDMAIREASKSSGFDVGAALVVAAIAIPNLLRSRIAANEASAVGVVRTVNVAQFTYETAYPKRGYAPDLATLGPDPHGSNGESADHANLLDASLANATCTAGAWCTKSGFRFQITAICKQRPCKEYVVSATPVDGNTGTRSFCSTSDGVIRSQSGPPLTAPLRVAECKVWPPLQ